MVLHEQALDVLRKLPSEKWQVFLDSDGDMRWQSKQAWMTRIESAAGARYTTLESRGWKFQIARYGEASRTPYFKVTHKKEEMSFCPSMLNYFPAMFAAFTETVSRLAGTSGKSGTDNMEFRMINGETRNVGSGLWAFGNSVCERPVETSINIAEMEFGLSCGGKDLRMTNGCLCFGDLEMTAGFLAPWKGDVDAVFSISAIWLEYSKHMIVLSEEPLAFPAVEKPAILGRRR